MLQISDGFINKLAESQNITILTGAGVSAESGIKTFRDPDGLWAKFNQTELASMSGFMANPELVWEWYQMRRSLINNSKPNLGHLAIAELEGIFPNFTLITQNVDRLHQAAGSTNVIELHGNIIENKCSNCGKQYFDKIVLEQKQVPKCPDCNSNIRPNVVWFGENLPIDALNAAEQASKNADVFLLIGTSSEVYPAAQLPMIAKSNKAYLVEINTNRTSITQYADLHLSGNSGEIMPIIVNKLKQYLTEAK